MTHTVARMAGIVGLATATALAIAVPAHADGPVTNTFTAIDLTQPTGGGNYRTVTATSHYNDTAAAYRFPHTHPTTSENPVTSYHGISTELHQGQNVGLICYVPGATNNDWIKGDYRIGNSLYIGYFFVRDMVHGEGNFAPYVDTCH